MEQLRNLKYDDKWNDEERAMFDELVQSEMDRIERELQSDVKAHDSAVDHSNNRGNPARPPDRRAPGNLVSSEDWKRGMELVSGRGDEVVKNRIQAEFPSVSSPQQYSAIEAKREKQRKYHQEIADAANAAPIENGRGSILRKKHEDSSLPSDNDSILSFPSQVGSGKPAQYGRRDASAEDRMKKRDQQREYHQQLFAAQSQPPVDAERKSFRRRPQETDDDQSSNATYSSSSPASIGQNGGGFSGRDDRALAQKRLAQQEYYRQLQADAANAPLPALPPRRSSSDRRPSSPIQDYNGVGLPMASPSVKTVFGAGTNRGVSGTSDQQSRRESQQEYARALQRDEEIRGEQRRQQPDRQPSHRLVEQQRRQEEERSLSSGGPFRLVSDRQSSSRGAVGIASRESEPRSFMDQLSAQESDRAYSNRDRQRQYAEALAKDQAISAISSSRAPARRRQSSPPPSSGPARTVGEAGSLGFLTGQGKAASSAPKDQPSTQTEPSAAAGSREPVSLLQYANNQDSLRREESASRQDRNRQYNDELQNSRFDDEEEELRYQAYAAAMRRRLDEQQEQFSSQQYPSTLRNDSPPNNYSSVPASSASYPSQAQQGGVQGTNFQKRGVSSGGGASSFRLG